MHENNIFKEEKIWLNKLKHCSEALKSIKKIIKEDKMEKSKIKELFESSNTVYIFDVDGVLAPIEYGEYNHYELDDEAWAKALLTNNFYEDKKPFETFKLFLKEKDINRIYVATKVMNDTEKKQKIEFLEKNYGIKKENIFEVYKNEEKLEVIKKIKEEYPLLDAKYFVMIEDSVEVLNYIMENSEFSTVHVSSFLK